jgi:hypothetical protein
MQPLDADAANQHHVLMISGIRRMLPVVTALLVMGTAAACGSASPPAPTPSSAPAATSAAAAGGNAQQFCVVVGQQKAALQGTQLPTLLASGTPAAWKTYLDQTAAANQQLVDAAPAEIKASVKTLQDGTLTLKSAMEAANYDVSKVGVGTLIQQMQSPQRLAAIADLTKYVQTQCGIDLTKVGG